MNLLIKNGQVVDPANNIDGKFDILVEGSIIKALAPNIPVGARLPRPHVIDASNKLVVPGLIDAHVHFREFGKSREKETIYSVSRASAMGGFTTIICQPNIKPRVDSAAKVKLVIQDAKKHSLVNFYPSVCITKGRTHKELVNIKEMKGAGAIKLTDDGDPVVYEKLMERALIEARKYSIVISPHCELSPWAESLLHTKSYSLESFFISRDIRLAELTHSRLHISHVSLADSVNKIREAKLKGLPITCEVTPHHFLLTQDAKELYGTNAKVNPPLRETRDIEVLRDGLRDGTIDVIASDHAPHTIEGKNVDWEHAAFGIIGLETTLGLVITELVNKNILSLSQAIAKMTVNLANIFNLQAGSLKVGMPADITIIDLKREYKVDINQFESMGRNCPFDGWKLKGKAVMTIVGGKVIMQDNKIIV